MTSLDTIVSLCKRRGFVFPGSDIYGGLANSWDFGPLGAELKHNIKTLWWKTFVHGREDIVGIDGAIIMNPRVWEASGHVANFADPMVECKSCHERFRVDHLLPNEEFLKIQDDYFAQQTQLNKEIICPACGKKEWDIPKKFNLLFPVYLGAAEGSKNLTYLRGETAQTMFVDFALVEGVTAKPLPFGIAQIGKAFRNEVTPGNFIFRTREFEQMEIEYFFAEPKEEKDWEEKFEEWRLEMHRWFALTGIDVSKIHEVDIPDGERAHYSKRTIDFEFEFPFGQKELYGLAYRTNFDLQSHETFSGKNLKYKDLQTGEEYLPHVIEPTWGVERTFLAILCSSYYEEEKNGQKRIVLKFKPYLAPYKVAVFPLVRNKPEIVKKAREIYRKLKQNFSVVWDDRGNIGKRYFSQDEIGTPWCVTIDYTTLTDDTVTVRDRDTTQQERMPVEKLNEYFLRHLLI
jgi:glycyl-tRNA synthetase